MPIASPLRGTRVTPDHARRETRTNSGPGAWVADFQF
jgi:hypothetical protein